MYTAGRRPGRWRSGPAALMVGVRIGVAGLNAEVAGGQMPGNGDRRAARPDPGLPGPVPARPGER